MTTIPLEQIHPNPDQPRKTFKGETIKELAESIRKHRLIQPIIVEPDPKGGYLIVTGERRWRALKLNGMTKLVMGEHVLVRESSNTNGRDRRLSALIENVQREDMNVIDEGLAYRSLIAEHGMKPSVIAQQVGKPVQRIADCLVRLKLPEEIRAWMRDGELSPDMRLVRVFLELDKRTAVGLAQRAVDRQMTVRSILLAAKRLQEALASEPLAGPGTPAIRLAGRRTGIPFDEQQAPPKYSALVALGKLPPWRAVINSAQNTCEICEIRSTASLAVCGPCPLTRVLVELVKVTK